MTYRNSLLSLRPSSTPRTNQGADLTTQFDQELPAAAPVFEGHLYLKTDNKQWQWRLFRFDGTCFTCLSTRKVKLPPNTRVDPPANDPQFIYSMPSFTSTSLTSPLLATPTNKSRQHSSTSDVLPLAKYYQLPKWTVNIVNISAVSVLKPLTKKKLTMTTSSSQRCFCVRTFDGKCYVMKAQKQKDLERWLFVLTKMWKFAQAIKQQLLSPQHQQILQQQQTLGEGNDNNNPIQSQDSLTLSQMYQRPRHASLINLRNINYNSIPNVTASPVPCAVPVNDRSPYTNNTFTGYEKRYQHPSLSAEKMECIDAWRQSLGELMASDPQLCISNPPPIKSIPDDDQISVISDMTSVSHRKPPTLGRRVSSSSSSIKRSSQLSSNKVKLRDHQAPPSLKKKRSNDVKNWIEPRKSDKPINTATQSSTPAKSKTTPTLPLIDTYQVSYFQDCKTTARSTSSASLDLNNHHQSNSTSNTSNNQVNDNSGNWISRKNSITKKPNNTNTVMLDRHAKYHSSTRAKQIQIVEGQHLATPQQQFDTILSQNTSTPSPSSSSIRRQSYSPLQQQQSGNSSPPARRSLDSNSLKYPLPSMMAESPLYSLAHVDSNKNDDEISLADLQRSLKRASLQQQHSTGLSTTPSPSSSVKPQRHSYLPPLTAPAIPPVPYTMMNMSRTSLVSSPMYRNDSYNDYDLYSHQQQNRKWKDQYQQDQQPRSWMPSCEQQKVMQQKRSIHLDTAHW
ncbi:hypothetical protein BC941DRAFT_497761 [Chlamydoabsidia padenii]|nr:hypothetical protein BC941DRAFT_497761 [Chlamydoabsidia padenii]